MQPDTGAHRLFRWAYVHDQRNAKFVLVSESCVPLHPLAWMHFFLGADARPRVHEIPDHLGERLAGSTEARFESGLSELRGGVDKSRGKRWVKSLSPLLPEGRRSALLQNRQFLIAGRAEVRSSRRLLSAPPIPRLWPVPIRAAMASPMASQSPTLPVLPVWLPAMYPPCAAGTRLPFGE